MTWGHISQSGVSVSSCVKKEDSAFFHVCYTVKWHTAWAAVRKDAEADFMRVGTDKIKLFLNIREKNQESDDFLGFSHTIIK